MRMCESANRYLAGLGGAVLLYIGVMGGTPALSGLVEVAGLPRTSAFVLWAWVVVALGALSGLRSCVARKTVSKE